MDCCRSKRKPAPNPEVMVPTNESKIGVQHVRFQDQKKMQEKQDNILDKLKNVQLQLNYDASKYKVPKPIDVNINL